MKKREKSSINIKGSPQAQKKKTNQPSLRAAKKKSKEEKKNSGPLKAATQNHKVPQVLLGEGGRCRGTGPPVMAKQKGRKNSHHAQRRLKEKGHAPPVPGVGREGRPGRAPYRGRKKPAPSNKVPTILEKEEKSEVSVKKKNSGCLSRRAKKKGNPKAQKKGRSNTEKWPTATCGATKRRDYRGTKGFVSKEGTPD